MASRIKARMGDTVEASFKLAYKKAEVARLADAPRYQAIDLFMTCASGNKVQVGAGKAIGDGTIMQCDVREITEDDQAVKAQFFFGRDPKLGDYCKAGEVWKLYLSYCAKDGGSDGNPDDPGTHFLAEVELAGSAS